MSINIFVAKLNFETTDGTLQQAFEAFGEVSSVKVIFDKMTRRSKGYGFVEMANEDDGLKAIDALNGSELDGRTIVVKKSEPRENNRNDRRGGGGYGRNSY